MVSHWFTPENRGETKPDRLSPSALWHKVAHLHDDDFQPASHDLFLVGFSPEHTRPVKKFLYGFSALPGQALRVVDAGYLTQAQSDAIIPIIQELNDLNICVMFIGAPSSFMGIQCLDSRFCSIIAESNLDDDIFLRQYASHLYLQYIATQRHLITESQPSVGGHIRLSELKSDLTLAEPCLRESDVMVFNLNSIHAPELGYRIGNSTSGLTVLEVCQLFRYAGASPHIRAAGIYGFDPDQDRESMAANGIAQMIWYFLEGSMLREDPDSTRLTEYHVDIKEAEDTLVFYKSEVSGRWWVKNKTGRKVSCGFHDYRRACQEDYSDTILQAMVS